MSRAKCRYGPNHESVALVDGAWWGEDTRDFGCCMAPDDECPDCGGEGRLTPGEEGALCQSCLGSGQVPGPHWPWRHDHPGPLRGHGQRLYRITHRAKITDEEGQVEDLGPAQRIQVRGETNKNFVRSELERDGHQVDKVQSKKAGSPFWW